MNNEQFRRLVAANGPEKSSPGNDASSATSATPRTAAAALGSRQRSSIPMTPRAVAGIGKSDFARQLAERNRSEASKTNDKKSRSYDPRGVRLAEGYTDRARAREAVNNAEDDDRERRIRALEESLKKEEIDQQTFERLRAEIAGGDLSSTHLVKGLDRDLLERVRRGEDVWEAKQKTENADPAPEEDVEDAFDELESSEVAAVARVKTEKKGEISTIRAGAKRNRNQLLAEMKAAREAKARENALGNKFKKIGAKTPGSRIERDSQGREVLIIVDEDGNEKRKVRKLQASAVTEKEEPAKPTAIMGPDKMAKPLGMEIPEYYQKKLAEAEAAKAAEDDDDDIFTGVGDDYDPLADLGSGSDDDDDDDSELKRGNDSKDMKEVDKTNSSMAPPPVPALASARNYFKDSKTALVSEEKLKAPSMSDPAIQAALKKAAMLNPMKPALGGDDEEAARAKEERHRRMLQNDDRDAEDLDLGFGTSRFEDEADFDESKAKLAKWSGGNAEGDDGDERGGGGGTKRKRGPKKRKGDGNNADDVMRLVEKRRAEQ